MASTLRPGGIRRYGQISRLLYEYGRSDLVDAPGLADSIESHEVSEKRGGDADPTELGRDLEELRSTRT